MTVPDYQKIMLPLLKFAEAQKEHSIHEASEHISKLFNLSEEEKKAILPSGQQTIIYNRVGWARTYLKKAGLLDTPKKSFFRVTQRGLDILKQNPPEINITFLDQFHEFVEFRTTRKTEKAEPIEYSQQIEQYSQTPQELLEFGFEKLRNDLAEELRSQIKNCSPRFFERLVVDVLLKMGYGGSLQEAGKAIGQSGDQGIDAIINEDKLGLDVIYIQAKRWEGNVGRPEIHKFVGALQGQRARKGIFITTSDFTQESRDYVSKIDSKIVLIDGTQLAQLMIDYDIGVSKVSNYEIKKIDTDYFSED